MTRVTDAEASIVGGPLAAFLGNVWNVALMWNWKGDRSWVESVPGDPALDWVTGALFALGVVYAIYRAWTRKDVVAATLVAGLLVLTLPSSLAIAFPGENPHLNRASPVIPLVFVLAALPIPLVWTTLRSMIGQRRWQVACAAGLVGALTLIVWRTNWDRYFVDYNAIYRQSTYNTKEIGAVVRGFALLTGSVRGVYLPVWPHWVDFRLVALESGDFSWINTGLLQTIDEARQHVDQPGPKLYILHPDDARSLEVLRALYPEGVVRDYPSRQRGRPFRSFLVPS
ncbi:MAG: putative rane protein [Chloroflexi bacterium]|nr:putative rane protein [Chloroflexota bacterium]